MYLHATAHMQLHTCLCYFVQDIVAALGQKLGIGIGKYNFCQSDSCIDECSKLTTTCKLMTDKTQ